jgi:hypothetical protein
MQPLKDCVQVQHVLLQARKETQSAEYKVYRTQNITQRPYKCQPCALGVQLYEQPDLLVSYPNTGLKPRDRHHEVELLQVSAAAEEFVIQVWLLWDIFELPSQTNL